MSEERLAVVVQEIEKCQSEWIDLLKETVAIRSVSTWMDHREEVFKMGEWLKQRVVSLGGTAELRKAPVTQTTPEGKEIDVANILLATIGEDKSKKTMLIYGHYDVQPAHKSDGWDTEPWELTISDKNQMFGRGTTDDKGPLLGWMNAIAAYRKTGNELPVNVKFICEGMEESGSEGFDEFAEILKKNNDPFIQNVDFCVISDNYWLDDKHPCLTYGLRGLVSACIEVSGPKVDLHSGIFGGQTYEVMDDLVAIFASLKTPEGCIAIPGVLDTVEKLTEAEKGLYAKIPFKPAERAASIGVTKLRNESDPSRVLMDGWRYPSLTIHGIEGAFSDTGFKTVIPRKVIGKFSIRLVPDMDPAKVAQLVEDHVNSVFAQRKSPNAINISTDVGRWWKGDPSSPVFQAAARATKQVHGVEPIFTREGGSIPITLTMTELTGKPVALIPMGRSDDGAHAQNEKLDISNYMLGMKTFATFFEELAKM